MRLLKTNHKDWHCPPKQYEGALYEYYNWKLFIKKPKRSQPANQNRRLATLKNAFGRQKQAITAPGLALLTLRYQLKREGCFFVSVFSADTFSGRGRPPAPAPEL